MLPRLLNGLLELIYPKKCLSCQEKLKSQAQDNFICAPCWAKVKRNTPPFCCSCGRHLEKAHFTKQICINCQKQKMHFDRAFSPCQYDGVLKQLIHEFKYSGKDYLGECLSSLMIDFIQEYDLPMNDLDVLIPIPLHSARQRQREFNQAEVLGTHIAKKFAKPLEKDNLIRWRQTKTQTELEKSLRLANLKGSFSINRVREIKNKNILLIDDVLTTGATCSEAAYVLKNAGANIVFVLTLAN